MKVAMYTFTEEKCGVAEYSRSLIDSLSKSVEVKALPINRATVNEAIDIINTYEIAHIQHNYEFWGRDFIQSSVAFEHFLERLKVPVVCTLHSVWPPVEVNSLKMKIAAALGIYNFYNHLVFNKAQALIIHTDIQKEILVKRKFKAQDIFVIPAGIPPALPADSAKVSEFIKKWGLSGKKTIGLFGFISRYKRYELAIDALANLGDDYVLVLAGEARSENDKKYFPEFMNYIKHKGVQDKVRITGFIPDNRQPEMFGAIDVFVVPYSENASISYALNICLAYLKPTIAADVELSKKIQEGYGCLELFKAGNSASLGEKIKSLSADEKRKKELSEKCKKFASDRTWDKAAHDTLKVYEYCIEKWKKKNA